MEISAAQRRVPWVLVVCLLVVGGFLYFVHEVLPPFALAVALAYMLSPLVGRIQRALHVANVTAVVIFYAIGVTPAALLAVWLGPALVSDIQALAANLPDVVGRAFVQLFNASQVEVLGEPLQAQAVAAYLLGGASTFLGTEQAGVPPSGVLIAAGFDTLLTLVLLAYLLADRGRFGPAFLAVVPPEKRTHVRHVAAEVDRQVGHYLRTLPALVLLVFVALWLVFGIFYRLPYALSLALIMSLLGLVPFIGPLAAAMLVTMVALAAGNLQLAVLAFICYFLLHLLRNMWLAPRLLGRTVRVFPAVTIFAVLAGGVLAGLVGALLAMPVVAAGKVALESWYAG